MISVKQDQTGSSTTTTRPAFIHARAPVTNGCIGVVVVLARAVAHALAVLFVVNAVDAHAQRLAVALATQRVTRLARLQANQVRGMYTCTL